MAPALGRNASVPPEIAAIVLAVACQEMHARDVLAAAPEPSGTWVVRIDETVIKIHPQASAVEHMAARLRLATRMPQVFLRPLTEMLVVHGRVVTIWPFRTTVDPQQPDSVPWAAAARLLATLHRTAPGGPLPPHGFPASVRDALDRLAATSDPALAAARAPIWGRTAVTGAARRLPGWATNSAATPLPGRPKTLVHGDFHLGQLVCDTSWRLIDIDALGVGDPVWDLARPAMWLLSGVIAEQDWLEFLAAYTEVGVPALPKDPWSVLEPVARAAAVQAAASALVRSARLQQPLDDVAAAFVASCRRIARS